MLPQQLLYFSLWKGIRNYQVLPNGSLQDHTLFLLQIRNLPKKIHGSLEDIYADDITNDTCNSKNLEDQKLATDLSSNLALVAQWVKDRLVKFIIKILTFQHHRADPERSPIIIEGCSLKETPCHEPLLGIKHKDPKSLRRCKPKFAYDERLLLQLKI